jgi:hypothetical protein
MGHFRLETFVWALSFDMLTFVNARLVTFVWEWLLENYRLGAFAWKLSVGTVRLEMAFLGISAWELLLDTSA